MVEQTRDLWKKKNSFRFVTRDEKQLVSQRTLKQHLLPRLGFEAPTEPDHREAILKSIGSYRDIVHRDTPSLGGSMCRIWNLSHWWMLSLH